MAEYKMDKDYLVDKLNQAVNKTLAEVDAFDLLARTMLTSEGTTNRSSHFFKNDKGYRTLIAVEAELIQEYGE